MLLGVAGVTTEPLVTVATGGFILFFTLLNACPVMELSPSPKNLANSCAQTACSVAVLGFVICSIIRFLAYKCFFNSAPLRSSISSGPILPLLSTSSIVNISLPIPSCPTTALSISLFSCKASFQLTPIIFLPDKSAAFSFFA